jgi:hypothetical protein
MAKKSIARSAKTGRFVLGSDRFAKISEVEGIKLTAAMKKRASDAQSKGPRPKNIAARLSAATERADRPHV